MYIGLLVEYPIYLSEKFQFSRQIVGKYSNIKSRENSSSGSRVVPYGRTDMKLKVAFRHFVYAPKY